jgi:hypothetical protein
VRVSVRAALSLLLLALALAGCASAPKLADCGLSAFVPGRPIDEGWRFDVKEVAGPPRELDALSYRFLNRTAMGEQVEVMAGNVGALRAGGNTTLRFLDQGDDRRLGLGDAFVVRDPREMTLQLSEGTAIVGTSRGCEG